MPNSPSSRVFLVSRTRQRSYVVYMIIVSDYRPFRAERARKERTVETRVSKSRFKSRALEYFRAVQQSGEALVVTDRGRPVLKLVPYTPDTEHILRVLRGSVVRYERPTDPVATEDWEALR